MNEDNDLTTPNDNDAALGLKRGTVQLAAADPRWPALFLAEADRLGAAVQRAGLPALVFEHVGSTAIPGSVAKPIIDLMAGYSSNGHFRLYLEVCVSLGYEPRGPQGVIGRELLVRGPAAARTHHLNLVPVGGTFWHEHILFRDYLRADPDLALAYATLKRGLAVQLPNDREAYTAGKVAFIAGVLRRVACSTGAPQLCPSVKQQP